jgi:serine/threonine-protein kinase
MGVVYRGRDPRINREVAVKAISLADEFDPDDVEQARARFFREAEMAGRLSHPHIVTIYDAGEDRGTAYIAMELLRGKHLVDYTDSSHLLPHAIAIEIVARLADALHYAHQNQVVHRDIKPANIMFDAPSGELKITDFGIARLTDSGRTRTGVVLGTPSFMSPEQLQGRPLTGRSDLFSLAIALFQLLTGQLPFRGDNMPGLMLKIAQEPHPRIRAFNPALAPGFDAFFDRALAKNPADRFESGASFAQALRDLNVVTERS